MRGRDEDSRGIGAGGVGIKFFRGPRGLRVARHGRASNGSLEVMVAGVRPNSIYAADARMKRVLLRRVSNAVRCSYVLRGTGDRCSGAAEVADQEGGGVDVVGWDA